VDRKDRDTSDWTISVKSNRWYLRLYHWMFDAAIHSSYLLVVHIGNKRAETNTDHPWLSYSGRNGRMLFRMDLAHLLMEKGLIMYPNVANFRKPLLRPRYSRRKDYHPCERGNRFFCKYRVYGMQHKKPKAPRFRVPLPGQHESPQVPPSPASVHPTKRQAFGWAIVVCALEENRKVIQILLCSKSEPCPTVGQQKWGGVPTVCQWTWGMNMLKVLEDFYP
jgi:hypothetical protein